MNNIIMTRACFGYEAGIKTVQFNMKSSSDVKNATNNASTYI